jgi:phage protein D
MASIRYNPDFKIEINDKPIPAALRASIAGVNYQNGLEGADRVELNLVNENLRWLDHPLLALDNPLTLWIGYHDEGLKRVFVGEIVGQSATFPSGGGPTLTVVAQDRLHRLQQGTKSRWFAIPTAAGTFPVPDPAVAAGISFENALIPVTDIVAAGIAVLLGQLDALTVLFGCSDEQQKVVRKQTESDAEFLQRLAQENGMEMLIDHDGRLGGRKLRFMSPANQLSPVAILKYGQSLVDFSPHITSVGQIEGVRSRVWLPEIRTEFAITLAWDWERQSLDLRIVPGVGLPSDAVGVPTGGGELPEESVQSNIKDLVNEPTSLLGLPRKLVSHLLPRLNNRLTGQGSTIGDPRIRAGTILQLEGLGAQFGGLYRVTEATHTLDSGGYRTSFDVRKEIWFGSIPAAEQGAVRLRLQGQNLPAVPIPGR